MAAGSAEDETLGDWRPILRGAEAAEARRAIRAIAAALSTRARGLRRTKDPSLAGGNAGRALFFGYLERAGGFGEYNTDIVSLRRASEEALSRVTMSASLYAGFPGVAWVLQHLGTICPSPESPISLEEIDAALRSYLARPGWRRDYDLVSGLVGLAVYALERLPAPAAAACLAGVVDRLEETAERRNGEITWHTNPRLLPPHQRRECPRGYHNLGLAHGVPGVIVVLAAAWAADVRRRKAGRSLEGEVRWLLAQKLPNSPGARFPAWIASGQGPTPSRSAWCYGDPGVAAALFCAARLVGETPWERAARDLARGAAQRPPAESGVFDATLCHGAAGLSHLYNRLAQASEDDVLRRAARYWLGRTLAMRRPGRGVGGYSMVWMDVDRRSRRLVSDSGFLTGAAGIGLALLAAVTPVEPAWDRMLLVSAKSGE